MIRLLSIILCLLSTQVYATTNETSLWVKNIGQNAVSIDKEAPLQEIFVNNLDIKRISLFVLGPYRRSLDSNNSEQYLQSIEKFISVVYAKRLLSYPTGEIQIIKNEDKGKRGTIVYSLVQFEDRPKPISVDWWVIKNKSNVNKVFDIRVSGIWMAQEQRSTFTSFLSKNNGDINQLIQRLNSSK
jgi:phospholipid transport system substrate-binding protein